MTRTPATRKTAWRRELLLLGAAAGVGWLIGNLFLDGSPAGDPPDAVPHAGAPPVMTADPLTGRVTGPKPPAPAGRTLGIGKTGTPPDGAAVFPDGTWLEPLNGVAKAPAFPGFPGGSFKPVVRIETNAETGLQWYIHEGDLVSTTQIVTHEAGGETWTIPEWVLGQPVPTQPVR